MQKRTNVQKKAIQKSLFRKENQAELKLLADQVRRKRQQNEFRERFGLDLESGRPLSASQKTHLSGETENGAQQILTPVLDIPKKLYDPVPGHGLKSERK